MQASWILRKVPGKTLWIAWALACIAVFTIQLQTLEFDPPVNQDVPR